MQDVKRHDDPDLVVLATDECLFADEGFRSVVNADAAESICRDCSGHKLMQTVLLIHTAHVCVVMLLVYMLPSKRSRKKAWKLKSCSQS